MTHKYQLDTSSKKYNCPSCGKIKTFVAYVYVDTKQPVDEHLFGRCDRENNCGYHHHPKDEQDFTAPREVKPVPEEEIVQIYPDPEVVSGLTGRTKTCVSPFHTFCKSFGIPNEHLLKWGVYSDGERTAFLFKRKEDGKVTNIKYFKYHENGHRDKSFKAYSLKQPVPPSTPKEKAIPEKIRVEKYLLGLFGEHLLDKTKKRTVCVVESEKTAVIASFFYPDYDWVSCMTNNGLTDTRIQVLLNCKVIWLCDNDKAGRENASIKRASKYLTDFHVADIFSAEDYKEGYDIADSIVDGLRPEVKITQSFPHEEKAVKKAPEHHKHNLPDGLNIENVKDLIERYGFFHHKNRLYITKLNGGSNDGYTSHAISNFSINALGLIESKFFPRRLIEIKNVYNKAKVLEVPTKAFASNTEFTVFVESEGNYQWNGSVSDLKKIRASLYDTMPSFEEVDSLGWHRDGYFIYANGVLSSKGFHAINDYGFVQLGKKNFYIEPLSCIHTQNAEDWEDEKKFVYKDRTDVTLRQWADLFIEVHKDNGRVALAWFITSLFRDFVYNRFKFFPHLFLFGPPGTGKSQVGWSIRAMGFNGIKKPFNLSGGTQVAFYREFSHFTNFPCWFDEYDNSIDYQRVQSLKAAYDGAGHKKSVKDSDTRTKTVPVNSACMISGQQLPIADNALFKRCILGQFHQTEFNDGEKKLFTKLQDMEEGGLTHLTAEILKHRRLFEKEYLPTFEAVLDDMIEAIGKDAIEDRILRNMCIVLASVKLLGKELNLPITYEEMKPVAIDNIKEQMALINNANETNTFWDMVSYLIDQKLILEEVDYKFRHQTTVKVLHNRETVERNLGKPTVLLYLRTSKIIPLYREHFKRQNSNNSSPMDKGSLIHYLQHQKYYLNLIKSTKFAADEHNKDGIVNTSAYIFNYELLESTGVDLKRGHSDDNISVHAEGGSVIAKSDVKMPATGLEKLQNDVDNGDVEF